MRGSPAKLHWLCKYAKPKLFILTSNHCKQKCIVALYGIVAKEVLCLSPCPSPQAHYCATFSVIWMDRYEHMNIDVNMICMKYKQYRGPNTGNNYTILQATVCNKTSPYVSKEVFLILLSKQTQEIIDYYRCIQRYGLVEGC